MVPSRKAVITAQRTIGLVKELGIARWIGAGNKVDRALAPEVQASVESVADSLNLEALPVA